ncbi:helicase HerA-like domain-containing protein [Geodermatophilus sp. Leaf369]|uniref:helicase HerA-like domain-containing protein n=1 Tax=Geodermatophilus sp. Leaf369 TaxID=1736354 RepID=UPI0009E6C6A7|nr:helicase HerA-like domain-containing protein [Geodermatophilus sp. Leaf369]
MTAPQQPPTDPSPTEGVDPVAAEIAAGYAFTGPALEFGAVVHGGKPHPGAQVRVPLSMMNRHGLIAGATGTGKTKTLQLLAEQLSAQGVPVVLADVKGDLTGLAQSGATSDRVTQRATDTADAWTPTGFPVEFLALGGLGTGVPVRSTITDFGPVLLAKVMDLNATQESSLGLVFHYADQAGLPLLDLKDLRAVISWLISPEGKADLQGLGGLSKATAGVILRNLIALDDLGGDVFFGEPEWETTDLIRTAPDGRGVISSVELTEVQDRPALFSTFLMWLLADLFEELPEVGDVDKPKLVFFFDEAHLLFTGASKAFLESVTQTVRLIRSKGVGVFFVTQNPTDVPTPVLGQLGNRVQHALRVFTPDDATALKKTVKTYPTSEAYDVAETLTSLGTGEAVVTVLSERGAPTPVAWTMVRAPRSFMGQIDPAVQQQAVASSPLHAKYATAVDRESAYEQLAARLAPPPAPPAPAPAPAPAPRPAPEPDSWREPDLGRAEPAPRRRERAPEPEPDLVSRVLGSSAFRSFTRSAASALGREITRGVFGTRRRR